MDNLKGAGHEHRLNTWPSCFHLLIHLLTVEGLTPILRAMEDDDSPSIHSAMIVMRSHSSVGLEGQRETKGVSGTCSASLAATLPK
ncbi:hypothetical protein E2C01_022275 [Portunus trituberculatus]|uniref:Uncharacterized protein n=1 Tax=Portunus trituberculatus TaxID=210409 RepID=A0A5B7E6L7_PORTR|nr:hypothetical protein [Portunus trituberculatus]